MLNFVKRDCTAEARPADEAAEAKQGQPSKFASGLRPALQIWATATKWERISVPRMRAEMGSPWSLCILFLIRQGGAYLFCGKDPDAFPPAGGAEGLAQAGAAQLILNADDQLPAEAGHLKAH